MLKYTLLDSGNYNQRLDIWVEQQLSKGKYGFALENLRAVFSEHSDTAIKSALKRLSDKRKVISIYKGYYLIIPPQYSSKGMLPPAVFLDAFMEFLRRPYYLGLLSAAAYHGASHQQPQEFFVVTGFPVLRPTHKRGLKLNYISKKEIPESLIESRKTESGYLKISNPILTATDLIQFERRVGGLNRVATILNELAEVIVPETINSDVFSHVPVTAWQRFGYIIENDCANAKLANALFEWCKIRSLNYSVFL